VKTPRKVRILLTKMWLLPCGTSQGIWPRQERIGHYGMVMAVMVMSHCSIVPKKLCWWFKKKNGDILDIPRGLNSPSEGPRGPRCHWPGLPRCIRCCAARVFEYFHSITINH
jgi:hypothetical protein